MADDACDDDVYDDDLLAALDRLESALETPVVPGELPDWFDRVRETCAEAGSELEIDISGPHEELFAEILAQDMALAARVEAMKENDQRLLKMHHDLSAAIEQLCDRAEAVEPHESKIDQQTTRIIDEGLAFVLEARKQEKAIEAWYVECFNRDRGVAD